MGVFFMYFKSLLINLNVILQYENVIWHFEKVTKGCNLNEYGAKCYLLPQFKDTLSVCLADEEMLLLKGGIY